MGSKSWGNRILFFQTLEFSWDISFYRLNKEKYIQCLSSWSWLKFKQESKFISCPDLLGRHIVLTWKKAQNCIAQFRAALNFKLWQEILHTFWESVTFQRANKINIDCSLRKCNCEKTQMRLHNFFSLQYTVNWWQCTLLFDPYYVLVYKYDLQQ